MLAEPAAVAVGPGSVEAFRAGKIGIYPGIPFDDYLSVPLMSQSVLKCGAESMLHLKYAIDSRDQEEPTDAMMLGSALHVAFLEPAMMPSRVVLWTGPRRVGKEWDAFKDEHAGKVILTAGFHRKLIGMVARLRKHPEVRKWLSRIEDVEVSAIGMIGGVKFKGRADALTDDPLWDLKKISSTDDRTINSAILTYGLHIQAHIYRELFHRNRFCLGFVEENPPHDVRVVELSPNLLKVGKSETTGLIQRLKIALETDRWPGRSDAIELLEPADWVASKCGMASEITFEGEKAFAE